MAKPKIKANKAVKIEHIRMEERSQKNKRRSFINKFILWAFIGFNLFMLIWMIVEIGGATKHLAESTSTAEKIGISIGTRLGTSIMISIWVAGDVILGLFAFFNKSKK
jgi:hypothetical protein